MRQATSILIGPNDTAHLGDGWGGRNDCVQIVNTIDGTAGVTLTFSRVEQLDELITALAGLSLDWHMRRHDCVETDYHASEGAEG